MSPPVCERKYSHGARQFVINASQPASDKIFDTAAFEKFLQDKIKVEGRVGNLGDTITIQQVGDGKIEITAHNELSGRYLKYLFVPPRYLIHPAHCRSEALLTSLSTTGPRSS